ncbi:MAG: GIY-YIG nuclease family protein [Ignavibacteriales bacterium]|nr:GIY-YIG nuclease family protein [Ignavibacteriales bacterium]
MKTTEKIYRIKAGMSTNSFRENSRSSASLLLLNCFPFLRIFPVIQRILEGCESGFGQRLIRLRRRIGGLIKAAMFWTYVLWSDKLGKRYVGPSSSIDERLQQHNAGMNKFTKGGRPWILMHREAFKSSTEARKRENFLKSGAGRKWLDLNFPVYKQKK